MLQSIHVKNIALIDDVEIELTEGLNMITGETGAGKSIIIDAVNFALGKRMPKDIVREDAEYALAELVFTIDSSEIRNVLSELEIQNEDDLIVLSRKIINGKNSCKINGETVTAKTLKMLSEHLIDIHGQHEHQSLMEKSGHMAFLDNCLSNEGKTRVEDFSKMYKEYNQLLEQLSLEKQSGNTRNRDLSLAVFEVKEIEDARLVAGEDISLEKTYAKMINAKRIAEAITSVHQITGYSNNGAGSEIGRAISLLKNVAECDQEVSELLSSLTDIDSILNDFNRSVATYEESLEFEESDFRETEDRLNLINNLKGRYGNTIEDILIYCENKKAEIQKFEDFDAYLENLEKNVEKSKNELLDLGKKISKERKEKAKVLSEEIQKALVELNFLDANFEISVTSDENVMSSKGLDDVEMFISTNPGERLKPLVNVASGGEISRIMLAIKSTFADKDNIPTLIFDEIDTGISGRTAQKVSEKMSLISKEHQVLCVTHLPQIAAMADTHFEISKSVENGRTVTSVTSLSLEEQIEELARMLSGAEVTETVISNAREMKRLADSIKEKSR